jgi:hypothetical protein
MEAVVIATVIGFDNIYVEDRTIDDTTRVRVERIFKGNVKVGDILNLGDDEYMGCSFPIISDDLDKQVLLYLRPNEERSGIWVADICGRSKNMTIASDDLAFLENLDKRVGESRISGRVEFEKSPEMSIEGIKIWILSAENVYKAITDKNGVYEYYGLPGGRYQIEPEIPEGFQINYGMLRLSPSYISERHTEPTAKRIPIFLEEGRHANQNIFFERETNNP